MLDKISGELRIFTREVKTKKGDKRIMFNACVGYSKNEDDTYLNAYVPVAFAKAIKKQVPYKEKSFDCLVKEAFFTAYEDKDGIARLKLFINKAKFVTTDEDDEEDEEKPAKKPAKKPAESQKKNKELEPIEDDSLPF